MRLQRIKNTLTAGVAATAIAFGLMFGFGAGTARADVLDDLAKEFTTAAGGGIVPDLLNKSLQLRQLGYRPTAAELGAIEKALGYRPNQTPLISALQATVAGQMKQKNMAETLSGNNSPFTIGVNQYDPNNPGGFTAGPNGIGVGGGPVRIGGGQVLGPPGGGAAPVPVAPVPAG